MGIRITEFWAKGYRSLMDLRINTDREFNVFYGPNGAGKSNILAGIDALFRVVSGWARGGQGPMVMHCPQDCPSNGSAQAILGATVTTSDKEGLFCLPNEEKVRKLDVEVVHNWRASRGEINFVADGRKIEEGNDEAHKVLERWFLPEVFTLIGADVLPSTKGSRALAWKALTEVFPFVSEGSGGIDTGRYGRAVQDAYGTLARVFRTEVRIAGIEEPETHLHAPTSGLAMRKLVGRLVAEGTVDQLFITTHSNLFDLDPEGYHDVTLDPDKGTQVEWRPLSDIDKNHLYEPGPAKHALEEFLRTMGNEDSGLRTSEGKKVGTKELLDLLQKKDEAAMRFLAEVNSAATRLAVLRPRKERLKAGSEEDKE